MREAVTIGGTVARVFRDSAQAETTAARLRAAGFPDVRLSERSGKTYEAHVAESEGRTAIDFAASLEAAGFSAGDARAITRDVEGGAVLLTVAAAERVDAAHAVLRGETVAPQALSPIDAPVRTPEQAAPADRVMQLREERLDVEKQRVTSEARVHKEVVTEERTITVPVQREELVVERDGEDPVRVPLHDAVQREDGRSKAPSDV